MENYLNSELTYSPNKNKIFLKVLFNYEDEKYKEIFDIFAILDFFRNFYKYHCRLDIYSIYNVLALYLLLCN